MDIIFGILADYYFVFLIVGIVLLIALIFFIIKTKKKEKEPIVQTEMKQSDIHSPQNDIQISQSQQEITLDNSSLQTPHVDYVIEEQPKNSIFEIQDKPLPSVGLNQQPTVNQNQTSPQPVNVPDEIDEIDEPTLIIEDTGKEVGTIIN